MTDLGKNSGDSFFTNEQALKERLSIFRYPYVSQVIQRNRQRGEGVLIAVLEHLEPSQIHLTMIGIYKLAKKCTEAI